MVWKPTLILMSREAEPVNRREFRRQRYSGWRHDIAFGWLESRFQMSSNGLGIASRVLKHVDATHIKIRAIAGLERVANSAGLKALRSPHVEQFHGIGVH